VDNVGEEGGGQRMVVGNNRVNERNNMNNEENNGGIMGVERTMKAIRVIVKVIQGFPFTTKPSNGVHYVTIEPITIIQTSF
jgi:hypothetical protein